VNTLTVTDAGDEHIEIDLAPVFAFDLQLMRDIVYPIPVGNDGGLLQCCVRHLHNTSIEIEPSTTGRLNFGLRVIAMDDAQLVYEDRLFRARATLHPNLWFETSILIPRDVVEPGKTYTLIIDIVKEHEYWFADRGGHDYRYMVTFSELSGDSSADILARLSELEQSVARVNLELKIYKEMLDDNLRELAPMVNEIRAFRVQIPRLLNAMTAANAAASVVGTTKLALDAASGRSTKLDRELKYQIELLWEAFDVIANNAGLPRDEGETLNRRTGRLLHAGGAV
jgi:hypothetical protein